MIPFIITMLVMLLGLYYFTIFLHLSGIYSVLGKFEINLGFALIPFRYWFKKEPKKKVVKKTRKKTVKKTTPNKRKKLVK